MWDFNYKGKIGENMSTLGLTETSEELLFIEALRDSYLYQHVAQQPESDKGRSHQDLILSQMKRGWLKAGSI